MRRKPQTPHRRRQAHLRGAVAAARASAVVGVQRAGQDLLGRELKQSARGDGDARLNGLRRGEGPAAACEPRAREWRRQEARQAAGGHRRTSNCNLCHPPALRPCATARRAGRAAHVPQPPWFLTAETTLGVTVRQSSEAGRADTGTCVERSAAAAAPWAATDVLVRGE